MLTHQRNVFPLQTEGEDDSIITAKSIDALIEQIRTLMTDSSRYDVRADFLHRMTNSKLLTPWATTVQPYPPFIQSNPKLLTRIREVRIEAARKIQQMSEQEFTRLATKLHNEGETLISTIDAMKGRKNIPSINERLDSTASFVGKTKATLQAKMEHGYDHLPQHQPTTAHWDDFFHYAAAYRRNRHIDGTAFEVSPSDKAEADLQMAKEVEAAAREDSDSDIDVTPHNNKRARHDSPNSQRRTSNYRIPKKDQQRKKSNQRPNRSNSARRTTDTNQDRDFARARPPHDQRATYYNSNNRGNDTRGGRDASNRTTWSRHPDRDRKIDQLQQELERLKRF